MRSSLMRSSPAVLCLILAFGCQISKKDETKKDKIMSSHVTSENGNLSLVDCTDGAIFCSEENRETFSHSEVELALAQFLEIPERQAELNAIVSEKKEADSRVKSLSKEDQSLKDKLNDLGERKRTSGIIIADLENNIAVAEEYLRASPNDSLVLNQLASDIKELSRKNSELTEIENDITLSTTHKTEIQTKIAQTQTRLSELTSSETKLSEDLNAKKRDHAEKMQLIMAIPEGKILPLDGSDLDPWLKEVRNILLNS